MMRRTQLGLVVMMVAALVAAGCGATGTPSAVGSSAAVGGLPDLSGQRLEVIGSWSAAEQDAFQAVLKKFSDATHAQVTYTSGGNDENVLINSRLAGGSPPDLAAIAQPGVVAQFAQKGTIKPLTGDVLTAVQANFSTAWQKLGQVNGQQYGFFYKVANKSTIWYRTDAFDQAGVKPPATWDDFVKASKALSDAGSTAMAVPGGDGWPMTDWFENVYLRVAGVEKYNQLAQHQIPWTDPTVVQSLQLLADYFKQPNFVEKGGTQLSFTQSVADVFGAAPKAAMLYEGDFVAGEIQKSGKVQVGTGAKFFPWPAINGSQPSAVTGGDELVMFKDNAGARALAAYLAGPDAAAIWAAKGGFLSANSKVAASTYPDDTTRQIADALTRSSQVAFDLSDQTPQAFGGQKGADEWKLLTDFLGNQGNPAGTAAALEAAAAKDYGSK
jgi:ABC-type glycerol-3-phosphate transport system substrate-binding protein